MEGKVTIYDIKTKQGRIQANDGNIYSFDALAFINKKDESLIKEGMSCSFEFIENKLSNFRLKDAEDFIFRNETFKEPSNLELISGELPTNYTLIDKAKVSIAKTDRIREKAIYKLKHDCKMSPDLHQEPHKVHAHCIFHIVFPYYTALFVKENCTYSQPSAAPHRFVGTFHISAANCPTSFSAGCHGDRPGLYTA